MQDYLKRIGKSPELFYFYCLEALNDSNETGEETKSRIKEVALLNNYIPNELPKASKEKTKMIGVVIPNVVTHFFAKSLHGIETTASSLDTG